MIANRFNPLGIRPKTPAMKYAQDGLLGHWDGIENIGYGLHDSDSRVWNELTGKAANLDLRGDAYFSESALITSGANNSYAFGSPRFTNAIIRTLEVVAEVATPLSTKCLVSLKDVTNSRKATLFYESATGVAVRMDDSPRNRVFHSNHLKNLSLITVLYGDANADDVVYKNAVDIGAGLNGYGQRNIQTDGIIFGGTTWNYNIAATICAVRVYDRVLSAEEIAHNFSIDKERFGL